jgi:hypothetical protein
MPSTDIYDTRFTTKETSAGGPSIEIELTAQTQGKPNTDALRNKSCSSGSKTRSVTKKRKLRAEN